MKQQVPIYQIRVHNNQSIHIGVGINPKTLCDRTEIQDALQVDDPMNTEETVCGKCSAKWEKTDVRIEPTVSCDRCGFTYSALLSRAVESMDGGVVPICKPCYMKLLDEADGVKTPYDEAEPYRKSDESRTFSD